MRRAARDASLAPADASCRDRQLATSIAIAIFDKRQPHGAGGWRTARWSS